MSHNHVMAICNLHCQFPHKVNGELLWCWKSCLDFGMEDFNPKVERFGEGGFRRHSWEWSSLGEWYQVALVRRHSLCRLGVVVSSWRKTVKVNWVLCMYWWAGWLMKLPWVVFTSCHTAAPSNPHVACASIPQGSPILESSWAPYLGLHLHNEH